MMLSFLFVEEMNNKDCFKDDTTNDVRMYLINKVEIHIPRLENNF